MADPDETLEKILLGTLQRVVDFLKFAETKNGALLTFVSAWTLAIIGILSNDSRLPTCVVTALKVTLPIMVGAGGFAIASFFPRVNLSTFLGDKRAGPHSKNLLYFGDIGSMTANEFKNSVRDRYLNKDDKSFSDIYIEDLSVQVFVNSQITSQKLRMFRNGLVLVSISAATIVTALILWSIDIFKGS